MTQRVLIGLLLLAAASVLPIAQLIKGQSGGGGPGSGGEEKRPLKEEATEPEKGPPPVPLKGGGGPTEKGPPAKAVVRKLLSHPALPDAAQLSPDLHTRLAVLYVEGQIQKVRLDAIKVGEDPGLAAEQFLRDEVSNWRFLSWYALSSLPDAQVDLWKRVARWRCPAARATCG
jgi:hypothetical protein